MALAPPHWKLSSSSADDDDDGSARDSADSAVPSSGDHGDHHSREPHEDDRDKRRVGRVTALAVVVAFILALVVAIGWGVINDWIARGDEGGDEPWTSSAPRPQMTASPDASQAVQGFGKQTASADIYVHVLGRVHSPGLYVLAEGSRLVDAVAAAGGLTPDADPSAVNLARSLSDGEQLYIPAIGESPPMLGSPPDSGGGPSGLGGSFSGAGTQQKINLNTATQAELETLPRVGPAMAQRILEWRQASGPFSSVDDLLNVSGFGEKTVDGLRDLATVR